MVGNGVTNYDYDCTPAYIDMAYYHNLYGQDLRDKMDNAKCDFGGMPSRASAECVEFQREFQALVSDVNVYDVYGTCYGPSPNPQLYSTTIEEVKAYTAADYTPFLGLEGSSLPPCTFGTPILEYYGRTDVREALNIPADVQEWTLCSMKIAIEYHRGQGS